MRGQVRKTSLARLSAWACEQIPAHNNSPFKLKIKQGRANRKQQRNYQAQSGIQKNTWDKLQKKIWSIYEAAQSGNK